MANYDSKEHLVKELCEYIINNLQNEEETSKKIADKLNNLIYSESQKPITNSDKNKILSMIEDELCPQLKTDILFVSLATLQS